MALSENYRTETVGRSDCRPIVRLSADTIVRWDYRPNPSVDSYCWWCEWVRVFVCWRPCTVSNKTTATRQSAASTGRLHHVTCHFTLHGWRNPDHPGWLYEHNLCLLWALFCEFFESKNNRVMLYKSVCKTNSCGLWYDVYCFRCNSNTCNACLTHVITIYSSYCYMSTGDLLLFVTR